MVGLRQRRIAPGRPSWSPGAPGTGTGGQHRTRTIPCLFTGEQRALSLQEVKHFSRKQNTLLETGALGSVSGKKIVVYFSRPHS
jgi:hypothetical protein